MLWSKLNSFIKGAVECNISLQSTKKTDITQGTIYTPESKLTEKLKRLFSRIIEFDLHLADFGNSVNIRDQGCSRGRDLRDQDRDMGSRDQDRDRGHLN